MTHNSLPRFRHDLRYFEGPDADDGSATYTVFDAVKGEYFKISWAEMLIIRNHQKGMDASELAHKINTSTTIHLTPETILLFFKQAEQQGLLSIHRSSEEVQSQYEKEKIGWFQNILLNYLFFKIPIFKPDAFLEKTYPFVAPFLTFKALLCYLFIALIGLLTFFLHWDAFLSTFPYFFNLQGLIAYTLAIFFMKLLHEFSHAYMAKKYGVRIPSMGVAILLLFPVLYTDVTDAWRLSQRFKRIAISSAGIIAELFMAGVATIGWAYSAPGLLNSVFFVIASLNWINTLAINLNPALRFDGYYMLSDYMKVENLQTRSFSLLRRWLYKWFLGLHLPNPEAELSYRKQSALILYAIYVFVYRVFLYTAIALFVYYRFTKALGIVLFLFEIIIFFIWPVVYEARLLYQLRSLMKWNVRLILSALFAIFLILWATLPLPHRSSFPAITLAQEKQTLYFQRNGKITELYLKRDSKVSKGDLLVNIESPALEFQKRIKEEEREIIKKRLEIISEKEKLQSFYLEKQAELAKIEAEIQSLQEQLEQNKIFSLYDGIAYDINPFLKTGIWVASNDYLGSIGTTVTSIDCFVSEDQLNRIKVGETGYFYPVSNISPIEYKITRIAPVRTHKIPYPQLASIYHAELPTNTSLELNGSFYAVRAELVSKPSPPLPFGLTGRFVVHGPRSSLVGDGLRAISSVLIEESQID